MEILIGRTFNVKRDASPSGAGMQSRGAAAKDSRTVTGYCSVFGNIDAGGDIVLPGAFKQSVADFNNGRSRARFLWNHQGSYPPVGSIIELKEVSQAEMPPAYRNQIGVNGALQVTRKYFTDPFSDRIYQGITSKAISEMSFGYNIPDGGFTYETVRGQKVRVLNAVDLMDCSDVNYAMNPLTMATVKGPRVLTVAKIEHLKQIQKNREQLNEFLEQSKYKMPGEFRERIETHQLLARFNRVMANAAPHLKGKK